LKLQNELEIQDLVEKNSKILDLNNIKFVLTRFEEYQVLAEIIKNLSQNKKLERILIIGDNLKLIFSQLVRIYPNAHFYIANISKNILDDFQDHFRNQNNYSTCILDVFKGRSLHDFIYNNSKFDLVITDKLFSKERKKKRNYSIRFLYKFYLHQNGILCIINYLQYSKKDIYKPLKAIKPVLEKKIPVKWENYAVQFVVYSKKN
jgi:hypothetical protein